MNKSFLGILLPYLIVFAINGSAQTNQTSLLKPSVDERVELMSIVFRLAGSEEYNYNHFKMYTDDIHHQFDSFKEHPLIVFTKKLIKENHVGYDAVMSMAVSLNQPPLLTPIIPFSESTLDKRWGVDNANTYVTLLQKFYNESGFKKFFKAHKKMYAELISRFTETNNINLNWFENFYGKLPDNKFEIIIGAGNGPGSYGPKVIYPDKSEHVYAIIGSWAMDSTGLPQYSKKDVLSGIIHEFNHSFANKLIEEKEMQLEKSAKELFKEEEPLMRMQAYGDWKTMLKESFVRVCTVSYLRTNEKDTSLAQLQLGEEESRGFIWTSGLIKLLDEYELKRNEYHNLESFMPEIVKYFNNAPAKIKELKREFLAKCPKVIAIAPFENIASNVEDSIKEMKILFDRDMMVEYVDYRLTDFKNPLVDKMKFDADQHTLIAKIKIEPNNEYGFILPVMRFRSQSGYGFAEDYPIHFSTKGFVVKPQEEHFGYSINCDWVTFNFEIPEALQISEDIQMVTVAGEFNNWNPQDENFRLVSKSKRLYQLNIKKELLGKNGEKKEFKFVVNGTIWIPVSHRALNKISHEDGSENLVIQL